MMTQPHSALIADPTAPARTSLRGILQTFEFDRIDTVATVAEARRKLMENRYDLVLCEYHFEGEETGQDLLEDMSERRLLPPPTLFIMVTTEASYPNVMSVAEVTPDEYVLKPIQTGQLSDRIERGFRRREALSEVYESFHLKDWNKVLRQCQQLLANKTRYSGEVAKLTVQAMCKQGRNEDALAFYRRVVEQKDLPWAKFGLAKMSLNLGDKETGESMLLEIIDQHLNYLPVYNQLADFYVSESRYSDALDIIERAIKISPNNVKRLQQAGQLAYDIGQAERAIAHLDRAVALRGSTTILEPRCLLQLSLSKFEEGALEEGKSLVRQLQARISTIPNVIGQRRANLYFNLASAAQAIAEREPLAAIDLLRKLAGQINEPEFDFGLALDYLAIAGRLYSNDLAETLASWVAPLALRFLSNSQAHELIMNRLLGCELLAHAVLEQAEIIEQTLSQARLLDEQGQQKAATEQLLTLARQSVNNRILEAAALSAAECYRLFGDPALNMAVDECMNMMQPAASASLQKAIQAKLKS